MIAFAPDCALEMTLPMLPVLSAKKNTSTFVAPAAPRVMVLLMVMVWPTLIVAVVLLGVIDWAPAPAAIRPLRRPVASLLIVALFMGNPEEGGALRIRSDAWSANAN